MGVSGHWGHRLTAMNQTPMAVSRVAWMSECLVDEIADRGAWIAAGLADAVVVIVALLGPSCEAQTFAFVGPGDVAELAAPEETPGFVFSLMPPQQTCYPVEALHIATLACLIVELDTYNSKISSEGIRGGIISNVWENYARHLSYCPCCSIGVAHRLREWEPMAQRQDVSKAYRAVLALDESS